MADASIVGYRFRLAGSIPLTGLPSKVGHFTAAGVRTRAHVAAPGRA